MSDDGELAPILVGNLLSRLKVFGDKTTGDSQPRLGSGFADPAPDRLVTIQRLPCPMRADFAEEPMLNRIPFRRARWEVANGDCQTKPVGHLFLQSPFPGAHARAVASAAVGEDQEL